MGSSPTRATGNCPLPRAVDAWFEEEKWFGYVLHDLGHGADWHRAAGSHRLDELWPLILAGLETAIVSEIREMGELGTSCRVMLTIPLGGRRIPARTVWHYTGEGVAPRLVTAFPET